LLDYFEVSIGPDGLANIIYADNGSSATHAEFTRQNGGPLAKANPTFPTCLDTPLARVVSRKTHGNAGPFDIQLPLAGNPGIECRMEQLGGIHHVVFIFANPVLTVSGATVDHPMDKSAEVDGPPIKSQDGREVTVNLKNVSDAQTITVTLVGVNDGTNTANFGINMALLLGDVNGSRAVSNGDVSLVKAQVSHPVGGANFRDDVNSNGTLSNGDVSITKAQVPTTLPP
jgi:hypothetical protein